MEKHIEGVGCHRVFGKVEKLLCIRNRFTSLSGLLLRFRAL